MITLFIASRSIKTEEAYYLVLDFLRWLPYTHRGRVFTPVVDKSIVNWKKARDWELGEAVRRGWPEEALAEAQRRGVKAAPRFGSPVRVA